jgi:hypothetical protein
MVRTHSRAMPWSSLIRAVGAKRHLPAERVGVPARAESTGAHRTMMGIDVSPVHGRNCICNRCAMLTERVSIRDAA